MKLAFVAALVLCFIPVAGFAEAPKAVLIVHLDVSGFSPQFPGAAAVRESANRAATLIENSALSALGDRKFGLREDSRDATCSGYIHGFVNIGVRRLEGISPAGAHRTISIDSEVVDCLGSTVLECHADTQIGNTDDVAIRNLIPEITNTIAAQGRAQSPRLESLYRYGVAIADSQRSALFTLTVVGPIARVVFVAPKGTAALGDLQLGDEVISIDGRDVAGASDRFLATTVHDGESRGRLRLVVLRGRASKNITLDFPALTAQEYAQRYGLTVIRA